MLTRRATARSGNEIRTDFIGQLNSGIETTRNAAQPQDVALFALARHKILAQNPALRADSARIVQPFLEGKASPEKATPATRGRLSRESRFWTAPSFPKIRVRVKAEILLSANG
jgi:hypothetical protein